tara:strand:- start:456 stop:620 length:165 start_codon:yes stop_codon:yes gene_type:complete
LGFDEKMRRRQKTEGWKNRVASVEKPGAKYESANQMSRVEYAKINPMFERMKHI